MVGTERMLRHRVEFLDADGIEATRPTAGAAAPDPRWVPPPEPRITNRLSPHTFLFTRPFGQDTDRYFTGEHFSMADHRRTYPILGMARLRITVIHSEPTRCAGTRIGLTCRIPVLAQRQAGLSPTTFRRPQAINREVRWMTSPGGPPPEPTPAPLNGGGGGKKFDLAKQYGPLRWVRGLSLSVGRLVSRGIRTGRTKQLNRRKSQRTPAAPVGSAPVASVNGYRIIHHPTQ